MGNVQSRGRNAPKLTEAEMLREMQSVLDALSSGDGSHTDSQHRHPSSLWIDANQAHCQENVEEDSQTETRTDQNGSVPEQGIHDRGKVGLDSESNEFSGTDCQKENRMISSSSDEPSDSRTPLTLDNNAGSYRSDANNCADIEAETGNSRCMNKEDNAYKALSSKHPSISGKVGSLFRETSTKTGNKKKKKGFVYLSPQIERKKQDMCETENSASPLQSENADFVDILTESEMTAAWQNVKPLPSKSVAAPRLSSTSPAAMKHNENLSEDRARTALKLGAVGSSVKQKTVSLGTDSEQGKIGIQNTHCTLEIEEEQNSLADLLDDQQSLASFTSYDEQGNLLTDLSVSPTKSLDVIDWEKVQQILDNLRESVGDDDLLLDGSRGSGLDCLAGSGDSCLAADLSCIERELATLAALDNLKNETNATCRSSATSGLKWNTDGRKAGKNRRGRSRRKGQEDEENAIRTGDSKDGAQGDIPFQEFRTTVASQQCCPGLQLSCLQQSGMSSWKDISGVALKDSDFKCLISSNRTMEVDVPDMVQSPEDYDHNTNETTAQGTSAKATKNTPRFPADTSTFTPIPVSYPTLPRRRKRKRCLSAPELRCLPDRLEPLRRLSDYDVPFSHRCDIGGPLVMEVDSADDHERAPVQEYLKGEEAYRHYKLLTMIETKEKIQTIKTAKAAIINKYMWKQRVLQNMVNVAKAYYNDPTFDKRMEWKRLRDGIQQSKDHSITDLRHTLAQVPSYCPAFTAILMTIQLVSLVVLISVKGLAPTGVLSQKEVRREIQTFLGAETVHRYVIPNPWVGPPATAMIASGASFAPCMRQDFYAAKQAKNRGFHPIDNKTFACCRMRGPINAAGTTTQKECSDYTNRAGVWEYPRCSRRPLDSSMNMAPHIMRPCCTDHRGNCRMLSREHCIFLGGTFHEEKDHCVEVFCLRDICTLGTNFALIDPDPLKPWLSYEGTVWQWWRILIAQWYTFGIMHCIPVLVLEWLLMRPLEKSSGWFPILMTYSVCGVTGQIVAGLVDPTIPQVGSTSGVAGMVGEAIVELKQAWKLLEKPRVEAFKLFCFLFLLLVMGFLPYVSLFGSVAGFCCGSLCALIFMPHITVDWWGWCHKLILVTIGLSVLTILICILLFVYIRIQPGPCENCRKVECLSFSDDMCNQWDLLG